MPLVALKCNMTHFVCGVRVLPGGISASLATSWVMAGQSMGASTSAEYVDEHERCTERRLDSLHDLGIKQQGTAAVPPSSGPMGLGLQTHMLEIRKAPSSGCGRHTPDVRLDVKRMTSRGKASTALTQLAWSCVAHSAPPRRKIMPSAD